MAGEPPSLLNAGRSQNHSPQGSFSEMETSSASPGVGPVPLWPDKRPTWLSVTSYKVVPGGSAGCPGIQPDSDDRSHDLHTLGLGWSSPSVLKGDPGPLPRSRLSLPAAGTWVSFSWSHTLHMPDYTLNVHWSLLHFLGMFHNFFPESPFYNVTRLKSTKRGLPFVCRDPAYQNKLDGATGYLVQT